MINHPLEESRWWVKLICEELEKVVPSFVTFPKTQRGAELQQYRRNIQLIREELQNRSDRFLNMSYN